MNDDNDLSSINTTINQMKELVQRRRRIEEMNKVKIHSEPIEILETEKIEEES